MSLRCMGPDGVLLLQGNVLIGRAPDAAFRVNRKDVSRKHLEIVTETALSAEQPYVELHKAGSTTLNGKLLPVGRTTISSGDVVELQSFSPTAENSIRRFAFTLRAETETPAGGAGDAQPEARPRKRSNENMSYTANLASMAGLATAAAAAVARRGTLGAQPHSPSTARHSSPRASASPRKSPRQAGRQPSAMPLDLLSSTVPSDCALRAPLDAGSLLPSYLPEPLLP
ncbi:hypothetical protein T492DRAFT_869983, partial [Pavlovales sp. CCMP2436]